MAYRFCLTIATVADIRSRRIPNWLVFPFLLAGITVSTLTNGWSGLAHSVTGVLLAALVLGLFYFLGGMGMGDVKLCASIGALGRATSAHSGSGVYRRRGRRHGVSLGHLWGISE